MSTHMNTGAVRIIEIIGISSKSFDDAIGRALSKAPKTVDRVSGFETIKPLSNIKDNKPTFYKVNLKLAFHIL